MIGADRRRFGVVPPSRQPLRLNHETPATSISRSAFLAEIARHGRPACWAEDPPPASRELRPRVPKSRHDGRPCRVGVLADRPLGRQGASPSNVQAPMSSADLGTPRPLDPRGRRPARPPAPAVRALGQDPRPAAASRNAIDRPGLMRLQAAVKKSRRCPERVVRARPSQVEHLPADHAGRPVVRRPRANQPASAAAPTGLGGRPFGRGPRPSTSKAAVSQTPVPAQLTAGPASSTARVGGVAPGPRPASALSPSHPPPVRSFFFATSE